MHSRWPSTFPSGQGSDLAGVVAQTGPGVTGFAEGDEVIGFTDNRASQAEYVLVEAGNLTARPAGVPWEAAGSLFVVGSHRLRGRAGRGTDRGGHRRRLRGGGRRRLGHRPARQARRRYRDRPGQPGQPRMAGRARGGSGQLRRRCRRPDPAGRGEGRRVHRHVRRGLRGARARPRCRAIPRRYDRPLRRGAAVRGQGRGQRGRCEHRGARRTGRADQRPANWRSRSPRPSRWIRCGTPTGCSRRAIFAARSSCCPDRRADSLPESLATAASRSFGMGGALTQFACHRELFSSATAARSPPISDMRTLAALIPNGHRRPRGRA